MTDIRDKIEAEARRCIGTPFHHQGRLVGVGIDCIGIVVHVARALGFFESDCVTYSRHPDGVTLLDEARRVLDEIPIEDAKGGDMLAFGIRDREFPNHLAILTKEGTLIHAHNNAGKVIESPLNENWRRKIGAAFRFRGVD